MTGSLKAPSNSSRNINKLERLGGQVTGKLSGFMRKSRSFAEKGLS